MIEGNKGKNKPSVLLFCGVMAAPLFVTIVLTEGLSRPDYDPVLYPLSSLALGVRGWTQVLNFIITGLFITLCSGPLNEMYRHPETKFYGPLLIALCGLGLIGAGIFRTDPIFGYPPAGPLLLKQVTFHGHLHDGFSMLFFICLPWACFIFRKRFRGEGRTVVAAYSGITAYIVVVAFILASMGFKQVPWFVDYAGAFQRLCVFAGLIWISVLSLYLLKKVD